MSSCDDFEIAIDQRLAGVLGADETNRLTAHLETCVGCRAYEESAQGQRRILQERIESEHVESVADDRDWKRVERRIKRDGRNRIYSFVVGIVIAVTVIPLASWSLSTPNTNWLYIAAFPGLQVLVVLILRAIFMVRSRRAIARLARNEDILAYYRNALTLRVRRIRQLRWLALAVLGFIVYSTVTATTTRSQVTYLLLCLLIVTSWAYVLLYRYPRLVRELVDIDRMRRD